jgi:hypothetical protein
MIYFLKRATLFAATIVLCSAANAGGDLCEAHLYELRPDLPLTHPSFEYLINDGSMVVSYPEPILPILTFSIPYPAIFSDKNPNNISFYHTTPEFLEQEKKIYKS